MTPAIDELIRRQFLEMGSLQPLLQVGNRLIGLGLLVSLCWEFYRAATGRGYNLISPVFRAVAASLVLNHLQEVGSLFEGASADVAGLIGGDDAVFELFKDSWRNLLKGTTALEYVKNFGVRSIAMGGSLVLYIAMLAVKTFVLDFLHPTCFCLALFGGIFTIPLGVFPRVRTVGAWLKQLTQIALWPVIFHFVLSLSLTSFKGLLQEMSHFDIVVMFKSLSADTHNAPGSLTLLLKFWAMGLGYVFLTIKTPGIARSIVNSEAAADVGSMMVGACQGVASVAAATAFGPVAASSPYATTVAHWVSLLQSPGSDGGGAGEAAASPRHAPASTPNESMNARTYPTPSWQDLESL